MLRVAFVFLSLGGLVNPDPLHVALRSRTGPSLDAARADLDGRVTSSSTATTLAGRVMPVTGMSDNGLELIMAAEGFIPTPRWDCSQWSVGYGTRTDYPDETVTEAQAREMLKQRVASISGNIIARSRVRLTQDHVDALTSLAYNIGESALLGHGTGEPSTLWTKLQANDFEGAAAEFQRWNKVGGRALPGLTKRRQKEAELFRRGNQQEA